MKQIVIDISDEMFDTFKKHGFRSFDYLDEYNKSILANTITNGTPLPEGHGDLIDRDKFKLLMDEYFIDTSRLHYDDLTNAEHLNLGIENCLSELDEMEPVIKADKRGKLI